MLRYFLLLVFFTTAISVFGQRFTTRKNTTKKALKFYQSGRKSANNGDIARAITFFAKALQQDPNLIDAKINIANLRHDSGNYPQAIKSYLDILLIAPDYDVDIYYNLALTYWKSNQFDQAIEYFNKFLAKPKINQIRAERAKVYLRDGDFVKNAIKNPVPFTPQRLSDSINTSAQEYLPAISADEETLIFTRNERGDENFYYSKKINNNWSKAKPLTSINTYLNEGAQSLSADGKWFIFTGCNRKEGLGSCDLYYSKKNKNDQWSKPKNLGEPINTRGWESQPAISADGRFLFFASEREGGKGKRDLWVSKKRKGKWTTPQNLGEPINTPGNEQSPFFHPDGKTLYFMSDGHIGMGGDDLYFSTLQKDGTWSAPQNLGYPINTPRNEGALHIARDGKTAYFATDRIALESLTHPQNDNPFKNGNSKINVDIFSFELPPADRATPVTYAKAIIKDAITKKTISAHAQLTNLSTQTVKYKLNTKSDGSLLMCLPIGENYALHITKKGYLFHSENFQLKESNNINTPYLLEIFLEPISSSDDSTNIKPSEPIVLKNVFFETAKATLRPESISELNRLKKLLEKNKNLKIQINGHTDNVGDAQSNQQLSEARAKSVIQFLIENGISPDRLSHKGFGETQPIDTNETPEGRQNNRRTEFVILQ